MIGIIGILGCVTWATAFVVATAAACAIGFEAQSYIDQQAANEKADARRVQEKMQGARQNRLNAIRTLSKATEGTYISMYRESLLENRIRDKNQHVRASNQNVSAPERSYGRPITQ